MSHKQSKRRLVNFEKLDERVVFSNTYFIDPIHGDDNANGLSPGSAVRTLHRFVSQYGSLAPEKHVELGPGDTLVLMPGDHRFAYRYGEGQWQGLFLRGVHGTADKPVTIRGMDGARIDNRAPDGTEMSSIYVLQSSHIVIENLDVSSYGSAIVVADATDVVVRNNYIHDVDGIAANNLSGIYLTGVRKVVVENNLLTDNYDRSRPGNANNRHIVVFGGVDIRILGNTMHNSDPYAGMAVDYKHLGGMAAEEAGFYEVAYNTIINAAGIAIGTAAPNSHIHHNLLIESGSIRVADLGGTHQLANEKIEFNTIFNSLNRSDGGSLSYAPTEQSGYPLGDLYWSHNLVVDQREYVHPETSTLVVDRYGSDELFRRVIERGLFHAEGNIYQTDNGARFDLYGANGGRYGELGSYRSFTEWQAAGFDLSGISTPLAIDTNFKVPSETPNTAGIYAGQNSRLVLLPDRMDIDESGTNAATKLRVVRSGSKSAPLTVSLEVSAKNEIQFSQNVTIPAGLDYAEVMIEGVADRSFDPVQAIQIRAAADGYQGANTWVRLHDSIPSEMPDETTTPTTPSDPSDPVPPESNQTSGVFQVPGTADKTIPLHVAVTFRGAEYNNAMGIAYVDDATGRVDGMLPSEPGWIQALLGRSQHATVLQSGAKAGDTGRTDLIGGRYFVFFLVQNASLEQWQLSNPNNELNQSPKLFTSIQASNPDHFDHVRESQSAEAIDLAWEDLDFGGDQNFTDLVLQSTFDENYLPMNPGVAPVPPPDDQPLTICVTSVNGCVCRPASMGSGPQPQSTGNTSLPSEKTDDQGWGSVPSILPSQWTNPENRSDVNGDGYTSTLDLLLVINALNRHGRLDLSHNSNDHLLDRNMLDPNGDQTLDHQDAFIVFIDLLDSLRD